MFNPSQQDVRRFFCETYRKGIAREILTPLESIALDWVVQHPEYQQDFADINAALDADYPLEQGKSNPFLHLSLHLTIAEQISINRPNGMASVFAALAQHLQSEHEAHHVIMEYLANMIWNAQRNATAFDDQAYMAALQDKLKSIKKPR